MKPESARHSERAIEAESAKNSERAISQESTITDELFYCSIPDPDGKVTPGSKVHALMRGPVEVRETHNLPIDSSTLSRATIFA